jgi:hypothetical protein
MKIDTSGMTRASKRDPIPGRKFKWIDLPCPKCAGRLYEWPVCCGAPEGLIECAGCDFNQKPSEFYHFHR